MDHAAGYVDTHFHIWDLERFSYPWPTAELPKIFRDFTLDDYGAAIANTPVKYGVFVQVLPPAGGVAETEWVIQQAETHPFLKGIVAGFDLKDPKLPDILERFNDKKLIKGVRNIIDFEAQDDWILEEDVQRGIASFTERNLTVDLCPSPRHWPHLVEVVKRNPSTQFVIDHMGKPVSGRDTRSDWTQWIDQMASCPNVHCKISSQFYANKGEPTEAEREGHFKEEDKVFVKHTLDAFGVDRCMFASDWPPVLLTSPSYDYFLKTAEIFTQHLTPSEKDKFFRTNAIKFYNLHI